MEKNPRRRPAARGRAATGGHPPTAAAAPERVQKVLARAGLASRREAEAWIRAGRLTINGSTATLGARIGPKDEVRLDGRVVHARPAKSGAHVFMLHRSPGEPLAASPGNAPTARQALIERLPRRSGRRFIAVSPMPRIDGGLELVTSDGELGLRLQRWVHTLSSVYGVRVLGELTEAQLASVLAGRLDAGGRLTIERCEAAGGEGTNRWYTLAARGASGKEVRQLFERTGARVGRVLRTQLGPLTLERSLARGQFRELTGEERDALLQTPLAD
jgi:23S rRNA pseudouridine2605 synthase